MLKLTSLALGLLTIIALAPASQAATTIDRVSFGQPAGDLHAQVIIKIGEQRKREVERRRHERENRRHKDNSRYERRSERHERHERHDR
jgi:hypothetical protein